MRKLARGGGNSAIAARELHRWAHEAMQMGALADGGKGNTRQVSKVQSIRASLTTRPTAAGTRGEAGGEAPSRPSAPRMRWLQDGFFFFSGGSRKKTSWTQAAGQPP